MDTLLQDLRYSVRTLIERPGFAVVAALTIALGVGGTTAMFGVVDAVLLRPLPYADPDRLVMLWTRTPGGPQAAASWPEFVDWREQNHSFADMAVWRGQSVNLTGGAEPERVVGAFVSDRFFPLLGARPVLGRTFTPEETDPATARPVAVLGHGLWQRRFGSDPGILGRSLVLNGQSHTVVGVLGPEFDGGNAPASGWFMGCDVFLPISYFPNKKGIARGETEILVLGRLRPGVDVSQARLDMAVVARRLEQAYPDTHAGRGVEIVPLHEQIVGSFKPALLVLLGAGGLVLLIACANVASLLLARASRRRRELAVRAALGAGRTRLLRQLLTESAVLALLGGALGLLVGHWTLALLTSLAPAGVLPTALTLDGRVMAFALVLTAATGLCFGLVPALQASRPDLDGVLKEAGRGGSGVAGHRFRDALVVAEVTLSLVLLVGAGLLVRSAVALQRAELGFRPDHVLTAEFRLPPAKYPEPHAIAAFFRHTLEQLRAVPGIESAALVRAVPFSGNGGSTTYQVEGQPEPPKGREPIAQLNIVSPDYFRTMGIRQIQGRDFDEHDTADMPSVAVVNDTMARQLWPGMDPIGRRLRLRDAGWVTVVGVVGDVRHSSPSEPPPPQIYTTHEQDARIFACVVVRTAGDPMAMAAPMRAALWSVDKDQPVWKVRAMEQLVTGSRGTARAMSLLVGVFAAVALALAGVGIYGVMAYAVSQRTREIGIRMALGAASGRVLRLVVGRALALTSFAIVLGAIGARALARLLGTLLFGVGPADPATFVAAAAALATVGALAAYLPARRAARIDPVRALAEE
ncbi:MAG: permease [Acidobacteria bacterium]|nr:MAG: permease [Acidobacteriota bacterium]